MINSKIRGFWRKYLNYQSIHRELYDICSNKEISDIGIYYIGCEEKIVYIGQSYNLKSRSIESLGQKWNLNITYMHSPWAIGFAPLSEDERYIDDGSPFAAGAYMNELESSAIRNFAPIYNTSIPSVIKSEGRLPLIKHIAQVFAKRDKCTAFDANNIKTQSIEAEHNLSPPWKNTKKRRKFNPATGELE